MFRSHLPRGLGPVPLLVVVALAVGALVFPLASPSRTTDTWSGEWDTNYGPMSLTQNGSSVSGSYTDTGQCPGPGTISGTVSGNTLKATWTETQGCDSTDTSGTAEFTLSGKHFDGTYLSDEGRSGSWNGDCKAGACLQNGTSGGEEPPSEEPPSESRGEVSVSGLSGKVEVRLGGGAWRRAGAGTKLGDGDEIHTGYKAGATLVFADGTKVTLGQLTMLKIRQLGPPTKLFIREGAVKAKVENPLARGGFEIRTTTATASVRGTVFSVLSDGAAAVVSVTEGSVAVDPAKPGLATNTIGAGKEVEVTAKSVSAVAKIGKAGARGGVNRVKAVERALNRVARARATCGIATTRKNAFSATAARDGWVVTVKVAGRLKGESKWKVTGKRTNPTNALAKKIAGRCS